MNRMLQPALGLFAVGMIGLGVLALSVGDFAMVWQPVAPWVPGRTALAYAAGVLMVVCGAGLLFEATVKPAVRVLFAYLIAWMMLKVPSLVVAPQIEGVWLGFGELAMLMAGGWALFARMSGVGQDSGLASGPESVPDSRPDSGPYSGPDSPWSFAVGDRGARWAQIAFGLAVIPVGLSHLFYTPQTVELVPAWLPMKVSWAYLTGVGQMACGLGLVTGIGRRVAAWCEAGMLSLFALLVWLPAVITSPAPKARLPWTAFWITWAIAAAAWVVAQSIRRDVRSSSLSEQSAAQRTNVEEIRVTR